MPARKFDAGNGYRYGFNGKRKDNEIYGEGNAYDFGARIYSPRLGRWLAVDPMRKSSPGETPYRFGHDNPLRFKDPDGNWEEDGHFWTVYAMGMAKGLSKARAYEIAVKAEYYDHFVHSNAAGQVSMTLHPWGNPGFGIGTWADPSKQGDYHALTGGLQSQANSRAKHNILVDGDLNYFHTLGDSWAHSYIDDDGVRKMWGKGKVFGITYEHFFGGGHGNADADDISKRPKEYSAYVNDLNNVMNSSLFQFRSEVKDLDPDRTIFNYTQQNGKTKENNIFLYSSYVNFKSGTSLFASKNDKQMDLLAGYFDKIGIKYERCSSTVDVKDDPRSDKSTVHQETTYTLELKKGK